MQAFKGWIPRSKSLSSNDIDHHIVSTVAHADKDIRRGLQPAGVAPEYQSQISWNFWQHWWSFTRVVFLTVTNCIVFYKNVFDQTSKGYKLCVYCFARGPNYFVLFQIFFFLKKSGDSSTSFFSKLWSQFPSTYQI